MWQISLHTQTWQTTANILALYHNVARTKVVTLFANGAQTLYTNPLTAARIYVGYMYSSSSFAVSSCSTFPLDIVSCTTNHQVELEQKQREKEPHTKYLQYCIESLLLRDAADYFAPLPEGVRSFVMSMFVCLAACISQKPQDRSSPNFFCMLPMAVAVSSSDGVAIRYVFSERRHLSTLWAVGYDASLCILKRWSRA